MKSKEEDIVLCKVKKIEGATVFVEIEGDEEGSISMSEIAAGRIRNLREYVTPNKLIVCKVLRIINNHPQLSLRRVTAKEREAVLERYKKEKTLLSMLKTITKNATEVIEKIKESHYIPDFIEEAREVPKIIEKFLDKEESKKLSKIISEKSGKQKRVKKIITLKSNSQAGVSDLKEILSSKEADIKYLGSSKFELSIQGKNFKEAEHKINQILSEIGKKAKEKSAFLEIKN